MSRAVQLFAAGGACAGCLLLATGGGGAAGAAEPAGWSSPIQLVPLTQTALAPSLAVNQRGTLIAAWFGDPPGHELFAAVGSLSGGFSRPRLLTRDGLFGSTPQGMATPAGDVAVSGSGVAYVAWQQAGTSATSSRLDRTMVAVERGGRFAPARPLLPNTDELLALASGPDGPVLAVWETAPPSQDRYLYYARLGSDGRRAGTAVIADLRGDWNGAPLVSVNDHGAIAAAWLTGPSTGADRLSVVVCESAQRCRRTPSLALFRPEPATANIALSLNDAGQVTVLSDHSPTIPVVVRAAVSRGGSPFSMLPAVAGAADDPLAAPDGRDGTVVLFDNHADSALTVSTLTRRRRAFARPHALGLAVSEPPSLVANLAGDFVVLATREGGDRQFAVSARNGIIGAPQAVISATTVGIDGRGDAIVMGNGRDAHGVFAEIHRG